MRAVAFARVIFAGLATLVAAACDEHFPSAMRDGTDASPSVQPLEPQPPAMISPDRRTNASSSPVVFDPLRGGVWTANGDVGTISLVDVDARHVLDEVQVGKDIRSIALSPDAVWIAAVDRGANDVALVDAETHQLRRAIALGSHPRACVWDAVNPRWLYVALEDEGAVAVIDRTLGQVVSSIDVGRLPSGVAVSGDRRELYVTHRIDGDVTVVDLDARVVATDMPLGDEPFTAVAVPSGKPLGFESLALTADGLHAWVPHELIAPTQPFVFNQTLFPAISVIDLAMRVEQQTDRNDPSGKIAGRKNLFDAINIPGPDGQPSVVSQLCALAMHPKGGVGWALACGSEDLLTFGVVAGVATDLLRNLPGDHPVGLALDDTGQRLFVLSDQSHTLLTLDTANGSPIAHTTLFGEPIPLVAHDPVDPEMRTGLTLFFRANSSKGLTSSGAPLTTTGNNWMSCSGCHIDGFGSTNLRLFEARFAPRPQANAQIGHVGLKDHFSTTPTWSQPSFDPHDILVALTDQGGLAPDRSGAKRDGEVDPAHPSTDEMRMAQALARVVARDLPLGPTWLGSPGDAPNLAWDGQFCGQCHPTEYAAWQKSVHAHAAEDPMVLFGVGVEQYAPGAGQGPQYSRLCAGCHDPVSARVGDVSFQAKRGITCLGCHDVEREIRAGGNGDLKATAHDWTADHKAWALASLDRLRQPEFCGGCHQQFVPGTGFPVISTLDEYHGSQYVGNTRCVDCHMQKDHGVADHHFPGGNVYLGRMFGDDALLRSQMTNLTHVVTLEAQRVSGGVRVTVHNIGSGHGFPTGVSDIREPWVELQSMAAGDGGVTHVGGPGPDGLLAPEAARLGVDIAKADGGVLLQHELTEATRVPFDVRASAGEALPIFVPLPASLDTGAHLDAVLYYRNVRTTYYRAATGDPIATAPSVEVARVAVP
ncbi:MAG: hypothetical protein M3O46_14655 [Myxococcota bacterium]|nr:hypothetical protein [Myxococcota bacterium]